MYKFENSLNKYDLTHFLLARSRLVFEKKMREYHKFFH